MRESWIDQALPAQEPRAEFVAETRAELRNRWQLPETEWMATTRTAANTATPATPATPATTTTTTTTAPTTTTAATGADGETATTATAATAATTDGATAATTAGATSTKGRDVIDGGATTGVTTGATRISGTAAPAVRGLTLTRGARRAAPRRDARGRGPGRATLWPALAGAAAAVAAVMGGVALLDRTPPQVRVVNASNPATVQSTTGLPVASTPGGETLPSSATVPATATPSGAAASTPVPWTAATLSAHIWVLAPGGFRVQWTSTPELRFADDGVIRGFDGCQQWSARFAVTDGQLRLTDTPVEMTDSGCAGNISKALTDTPAQVSIAEGGVLSLTLQRSGLRFVARDTLPQVATAPTGMWLADGGPRVRLEGTGLLALGACQPAATWTIDASQLSVKVVNSDGASNALAEMQVCAGQTRHPGHPLVGMLTNSDSVSVLSDPASGSMLLAVGTSAVWLQPTSLNEPAMDLRSGTLHGFRPYADVDSDYVVAQLTASLGKPRRDTGWYTTPARTDTGGSFDCFGNIPARVVQWDQGLIGFIQLDGKSRLIAWSVGEPQRMVAEMRAPTPEWTESAGVESSPDGVGLGSRLADFRRAGYGLSLIEGRSPAGEVTQIPVEATDDQLGAAVQAMVRFENHADINGRTPSGEDVDGTAGPSFLVRLDKGVVVEILAIEPGFC